MKIPQMILAEMRRLTATPMARIALIALCIVPLLYGGVYLWANQDPYERLDQVPVALVVLDEGAESNGERQNLGQDVADEVVDDGSFDWHVVNEHQAQAGVEDGTYDFSLTFPQSFSADLLSAATEGPRPASLVLTTNDANSYLATTIGEQAVQRIQGQVREQVGKEAAVRLLTSIQDIRDGMVTAADGAAQLEDGIGQARDGVGELEAGAAALSDGAGELASGAGELNDGLGEMRSTTASLPGQTRELADGASQVADGNAQLADVGNRAADASQTAANRVGSTREEIVQSLREQGLTEQQIAEIMAPLDELGGLIHDGNDRVQGVNSQLQQLADGSRQVADGTEALASGIGQLTQAIVQADDGATALAEGSVALRDGTLELQDGVSQLDEGLTELQRGSEELREGLDGGVAQIPDSGDELIREQAGAIAAPVEVDSEAVTRAGTYGAGLAPFFISLAAWIGIYALLLIVKPVSRRAVTALHQPVRVAVAAWLTPALFGLLQMTALFGVIAAWLQFDIAHPLQTFGIMALASATFAAIIVALNVWLGSVGQFTGLVLLVLQLVTAGGTFPWQTLPEPLATMHHLLPMSYAVDALRQVMYGGNVEAAITGTLVLAGFLVGALALTAAGVARMMDHRTLRDLRPSLIG
ncbi:MAG TPA: YhgE/Pip domain-containing protein [Candidatus Agrococcus pullicola]|uniref:YhgE/Pip domain-containing protein n=1 Tax=Candidatus Agrococcus pullicola TaxID=2838429 RepID=A0A9D2C7L3_9MICO|nr:YhgE/Pip domain-containing protein [Candidatus Agrococcus pullicola]